MISISKKYAVVFSILVVTVGSCWAMGSPFSRIDYVESVSLATSLKLDRLSENALWRYNKKCGCFDSTKNPHWNETAISLLFYSATQADLTSLAFVLAEKIVNVNYIDQYGNFALKMALDGDKQESHKRDYAQRKLECVVLLLECGANPDLVCQGMQKKMKDPAVGIAGVARELIGYAQVKNCIKYAACADDDCEDNFPDDAVVITESTDEERFAAITKTFREE